MVPGRLPISRSGTKLWSSILLAVIRQSLRASAGEIGGMSGKKFGFGRFRARPVIRQNDIFDILFTFVHFQKIILEQFFRYNFFQFFHKFCFNFVLFFKTGVR